MRIRLGIVMDPIHAIHYKKDSSLAMLLAAQARDWELYYMEPQDLYIADGQAMGSMRALKVHADPQHWFDLEEHQHTPLADLDVILMRKDPPFDNEFLYATHILEAAERAGAFVVNRAASLRDCNEKLFATQFPQCAPEHVVAQRYLPEIKDGDKRILMIDGEPVPYCLARIPQQGETRGNLAAGGRGEARPLTERDRWIAQQVGPSLRERGLVFVGLDVIGDYLTEINVTSPTCIREIDAAYQTDIGGQLMDSIDQHLKARRGA